MLTMIARGLSAPGFVQKSEIFYTTQPFGKIQQILRP